MNRSEDVSAWPPSRYFREVVMSQPDGRLLVYAGVLNWATGSLLIMGATSGFGFVRGLHPLLFALMPFVGLIWFLRSSPPPRLTAHFNRWRKPWQRTVDVVFQLFPALLPWWVIFTDAAR
jgi:hypothetical protein